MAVEREPYFRSETDQAEIEAAQIAFGALSKAYLDREVYGIEEILAKANENASQTQKGVWSSPTHDFRW